MPPTVEGVRVGDTEAEVEVDPDDDKDDDDDGGGDGGDELVGVELGVVAVAGGCSVVGSGLERTGSLVVEMGLGLVFVFGWAWEVVCTGGGEPCWVCGGVVEGS